MTDPTRDQGVPPVPPAPPASDAAAPATPPPVPPAYTPPAYGAPASNGQPAPYRQSAPGQQAGVDLSKPETAQPGFSQPGASQPGYAQPGYQQPGYQQPGYQQTGSPQPGYAQTYTAVPASPPRTLSLIGMIAGIVGVVAFGYFLPASIAALVLGYMGKKREGLPARGFWLTAIILGWVGVGITVIGGIALIAIFALAGMSSTYSTY